jgi:hypothetical protein
VADGQRVISPRRHLAWRGRRHAHARISPRSILLIPGLAGQPQEALNRACDAAAKPPKALWEVSGARHTAALSARPAE